MKFIQKDSDKKVSLVVTAVACLVGVIGLGYFAWIGVQKPVTQQMLPSVTDTKDWKTYTNSKLGFEIKYPSDISPQWMSQSDDAVLRLAGDIGDVFLEVAMSAYSLEEVQKISFSASNYKVEWVFLDGEKAMKVTNSNDLSVSPRYSIYVIKNGFVYSVAIPLKSVDAEKILSTFKFTK